MRPDRHHQDRCIREYAELVAQGVRKVLIQMPTGAGKTHVGLRCAEMATRRTLRVLWLAHRDELVDQPKDRILAESWPVDDLCVIKAGRTSGNRAASLTIASVQTLLAMGEEALAELIGSFDLIILDEARHYAAKVWSRVWRRAKPDAYLLGLDATPVRQDGSPMGDLFDRLLVGATVRELVDAGHLVPSVVIAPAAYQDDLASDPVDAYRKHVPGQSAIVFCGSVRQSADTARRLTAGGWQAEHVDGKTREDVRAAALRRFVVGSVRVLCNVRILTEGTDLPRCEAIVHATKCGSLSDRIQKDGRGSRTSPNTGKRICTIVDLHGQVHEYGFPDDSHVYTLSGQGVQLADALPPIGQCPMCYAWGRSRAVCAQCGHRLPEFMPPLPKVRAADMAEVRRATDSEDTQRERLARFVIEALRRGVSPWSAAHRWRGTYGVDAPREWVTAAIASGEDTMRAERAEAERREAPLFNRGEL